MSTHCHAWHEIILERATGDLAPDRAAALERHLAMCAACAAEAAAWRLLADEARSALRLPAPPLSLALRKVRQATQSQTTAAPAPRPAWRRQAMALVAIAAVVIVAIALRAPSPSGPQEASSPVHRDASPDPAGRVPAVALVARRQTPADAEPAGIGRQSPIPVTAGRTPNRQALARGLPGDVPAPAAPLPFIPAAPPSLPQPGQPPADPDPVDARPTSPETAATPEPLSPAPTQPEPLPPAPPSSTPAVEPGPPQSTSTAPPPAVGLARVAGRVEDANGQPVAWALVYLRPAEDDGWRAVLTDTDLEGDFAVDLSPGRWELWVEADGLPPLRYKDELVLDLGSQEDRKGIVIRLPGPRAEATQPQPTQPPPTQPPPSPTGPAEHNPIAPEPIPPTLQPTASGRTSRQAGSESP